MNAIIFVFSDSRKRVEPFLGNTLFSHIGLELDPTLNEFLCPLRNVSECSLTTKNDNIILLVYNPLSRPVAKYIRFPVAKDATDVNIYDDAGELVNVNLLPIHPTIKNIPGRKDNADMEALFYASDIPPLGYRAFYVDQVKELEYPSHREITEIQYIDDESTLRKPFGDDFEINMEYYISSEESDQPSGAYIFRPRGENDQDKCSFSIFNVSKHQKNNAET